MILLKKNINLETFLLIDYVKNMQLIDDLLKEVYSAKENDFLKHYTNVIAKRTNGSFLNNNKIFHQFLISIDEQIQSIFKNDFLIEHVWANILNGNDSYIKEHDHVSATAFSGILYLTDGPGPGTYFNEYDKLIEEEKGKFVLFHGHLKHSVSKFVYNKDRVTISWNFTKCPTGYTDNFKTEIINKK